LQRVTVGSCPLCESVDTEVLVRASMKPVTAPMMKKKSA
jgi:hypothetical protein